MGGEEMNQNIIDSIWRGIYLVERECQREVDAGEVVNIVREVLEENKTTRKIIAKGRVTQDGGTYFLSVPDDPEQPRTTMWRGWVLGRWAKPYWNQWLTISIEENNDKEK